VIARVFYDGNGHGSSTVTESLNGTIYQGITATATFTVNSDCTGNKTFVSAGGSTHYNFVITPDGKTITWVQTDTGVTLSGVAVRMGN
jgi:hypothetical protein